MSNSLKRFPLLTMALVLAACGQNTQPAAPMAGIPAGTMGHISSAPTKWFVELEGDPSVMSVQSVGAQQASFRALAAERGIQLKELAAYSTLFNGFSVEASSGEINRVTRMPGVQAVYPVEEVERPKVQRDLMSVLVPDMIGAVTMTGADFAQNELGLTGRGIKVAVMDSGIDVDHPAFAGRITAGYDFVGDAFGSDGNRTPAPDENPDDCGGHGTHVAGIVGGNDASRGFKGVAPEVSFGAYKVFGCDGSTDADIMLQAMERAYNDGMHILNMSIGAAFQWPQYPTAKAASRLVKRGMVVSVSAGNSGTSGQYATGAPSLGENVMAVASVDNIKLELRNFTITPDGSKIGYQPATGAPAAPSGLSLPITKAPGSTITTANDGCSVNGASPYAANSLAGKAVLIRRGTCSFREKTLNAQRAGARAVILYNNTSGFISPTVAPSLANDNEVVEIPVVSILQADGQKIDALIANGTTATFNAETSLFNNPVGNTLSSFSSYGMSPDLELKPDLSAPGGLIKSTYPLSVEATGYAVLSGTSMAAPHVAGVAALMLQAYPGIQAKDMRTRLMNTSSLRYFRNASGTLFPFPDYVQRQGAGMVDVVNAYNSTVSVTPSKISLGESETFASRSKVLVLKNTGPRREVYNVTHTPALTVAGTTLAPTPNTAAATVTVNGQSVNAAEIEVVVPPFGEVELNVEITPPASAPDKAQYGGYVFMRNANGSTLNVPYSGFKGDYQSIKVLGNATVGGTSYDFPVLFDSKEGVFFAEGEALTALPDYTFADGDRPQVLAHFAHQARRVTFELLDGNGAAIDVIRVDQYVGRNATNIYTDANSDAFDSYTWDGKFSDGKVAPNGVYQLRLRVLKALGDESNPNHTEVYMSQRFAVVR